MKGEAVVGEMYCESDNKPIKKEVPSHLSGFRLYFSALAAALISFNFGTNLANVEIVLSIYAKSTDKLPDSCPGVNFGNYASIICIGAVIATVFLPFFNFPKKSMFLINNFFYLLGASIVCYPQHRYIAYLGRMFIGVGFGFTCAMVPGYLGQISPVKFRGMFCGIHQLFLSCGLIFGKVLSMKYGNDTDYVFGLKICASIIALSTVPLFFISIPKEQKNEFSKSMKELFFNKDARKSIFTLIFLHVIQQLSHINAITLFTGQFYQNTVGDKASLYAIWYNIVGLIAGILSMLIVDKFGRKIMLSLSLLMDGIALIGLYFEATQMISTFLFSIGFAIGLGPIVWSISCEIFPGEYVIPAISCASVVNWSMGYFILYYFGRLSGSYPDGAAVKFIAPFGVIMILAIVYVQKCIRETKGRESGFQ